MHIVARHGQPPIKANKDAQATLGRIYDAGSDKARFSFPDLSKFTAQAEVFTSSPWVFIAVDLVAKNCGLVNLNVYELGGSKRKLIENHPFHQLMRAPNDHQTQSEFVYAMVASRILAGNAYIYLVSGKGGAPDEMLLLRPDAVKIVPGRNGQRIGGYLYEIGGADPIPLDPEQVIHWKGWHPLDPYYGLSLVQVMALSVQAEKGMSTWQAKFFSKENAVPAGIVAMPPTMSNQDYQAFKSEWYRAYGGTQRATAIIRANDFQYHPIGTSHVDMDFMQGRLFEKEVILNCIGVPISIFAVNANEANARAGMELLTSMTIWPIMVQIGQKITADLLPFWDGSGNTICEADDIRVKDERAELQQMQAAGPLLSINELRAKYFGLDPVGWGDRPPAGAQATPGGMVSAFGKPQVDATQQKIQAEDSGQGEQKTASLTPTKDCYVLLSLANDPAITAIQSQLKQNYPNVTWEDPADFHVTLVYATSATDLQQIKDILPTGINALSLEVGPTDTFDNSPQQPVFLKVKMTPELKALQSALFASFNSLELELSPFSKPDDWTPHITLGYLPNGTPLPTYSGTSQVTGKALVCCVESGDDFNVIYSTKKLPEPPPSETLERYIQAVARHEVLTSASKQELQRFVKFASKRLWNGETKAVESFKFNDTPAAYQVLARAYGDVAKDVDELQRMIDWQCGNTVKAVLPADQRVSTSGKLDPLAKEKTTAANRLQSATSSYLQSLRQRIADHAEHQPTSGFWNGEQQQYQNAAAPVVKGNLLALLTSLAALVSMQNGVTLDQDGLKADVDSLYAEWLADTPSDIIQTTKDGIDAIFQRWRDSGSDDPNDLVSALDNSYLVSDGRADAIAETETTKNSFQVTRITGRDVANRLDVQWLNDDMAGPPLHPNCRCFTSVEVQSDDNGDPTGVDRVFHTVNDSHVCDLCSPLNGMTFSEIADSGDAVKYSADQARDGNGRWSGGGSTGGGGILSRLRGKGNASAANGDLQTRAQFALFRLDQTGGSKSFPYSPGQYEHSPEKPIHDYMVKQGWVERTIQHPVSTRVERVVVHLSMTQKGMMQYTRGRGPIKAEDVAEDVSEVAEVDIEVSA